VILRRPAPFPCTIALITRANLKTAAWVKGFA